MWNWRNAARNSVLHGRSWRDDLRSDEDREVFDKIAKMRKKDAEAVLSTFLDKKYITNKDDIDMYIEYLNKVYSVKLNDACELLKKLTGKESYFKKFIIRITTFPRSPYDDKEGSFYMKFNIDNTPIATFLHEALHFQFHNYWREDPKSPVSKLSANDFDYLKESLTVILDNSLVPFIEVFDQVYLSHEKFRKALHKQWQKHHDFDKLVEFGLKELPKY